MNIRLLRKGHVPILIIILVSAAAIICEIKVTVEGKELPSVISIDYIQKQYGPVNFDHAMHTGLAEGCGTCHHQHKDKQVAVCKECHTLDPAVFKASAKEAFLPCSGCHSDYSPDTPGMPGLKVALHKTCFRCHIGIGDLGSSPRACSQMCHEKISTK